MRGSDKKGYVSNFIGIVPAAEPEAVILVMVDNPKAGKKYGSEVAGPVFKQVAQNVIETLGLRPTLAPGQLQSAKKADAISD
jgi:cell division protein FtsI/penicillin-binding protein 2